MSVRRPAQTHSASVEWLGWAAGTDFATTGVEWLHLTYAGIPGDVHEGLTRKSGAREPWYPRGTPMRNERQVSLLSREELNAVAETLAIPDLDPAWIGGNFVFSGLPAFSTLPPRTLLMFPSGAAIRVDGDNGPCRASGRGIVRHIPERPDLEFGFVKAAKHRRGLVGWVEREGEVRVGDTVSVRVWEQALYP